MRSGVKSALQAACRALRWRAQDHIAAGEAAVFWMLATAIGPEGGFSRPGVMREALNARLYRLEDLVEKRTNLSAYELPRPGHLPMGPLAWPCHSASPGPHELSMHPAGGGAGIWSRPARKPAVARAVFRKDAPLAWVSSSGSKRSCARARLESLLMAE